MNDDRLPVSEKAEKTSSFHDTALARLELFPEIRVVINRPFDATTIARIRVEESLPSSTNTVFGDRRRRGGNDFVAVVLALSRVLR